METVSFASHNQRGKGMIMIEVPQQHIIRAEDLIRLLKIQ